MYIVAYLQWTSFSIWMLLFGIDKFASPEAENNIFWYSWNNICKSLADLGTKVEVHDHLIVLPHSLIAFRNQNHISALIFIPREVV